MRQRTVKDPKRNTALDKKEAEQVDGGKRPRKEVATLPKPLGRTMADGALGRGRGGGTRGQGVWESRPTIADEHGKAMDRGGEEAIREMEKLANDQLVEQLGRQMNSRCCSRDWLKSRRRTTGGSGRSTWPSESRCWSWRRRRCSKTAGCSR